MSKAPLTSKATQTEMVYELLKRGPLTSAEAFTSIGCVHLPRRIKDLKELGVPVVSVSVDAVNRFGEKTHFSKYSLAPGGVVPTTFAKAKRNPFLAGMMFAAKVIIRESDLVAAKASLKKELIKAARR